MESKVVPRRSIPASPLGESHATEFEVAEGIEADPKERSVELLPESARLWPAMTHPVVGYVACQFDGQVYGIEIEKV